MRYLLSLTDNTMSSLKGLGKWRQQYEVSEIHSLSFSIALSVSSLLLHDYANYPAKVLISN